MSFQVNDPKKLTAGVAVVLAALVALFFGGSLIKNSVTVVPDQAVSGDVSTDSVKSAKRGMRYVEKTEMLAAYTPVTELGYFVTTARNASGEVLWTETSHNALTFVGQQKILNCFFKALACPLAGAQYVMLLTATPVNQQATMAVGITELTAGLGYTTRFNIAAWTVSANAAANNTASNTTAATWTATGTWAGVTALGITDGSATPANTTGTLLAYSALSATRTLQNGDTLNVTYTLTLQ